MNTTTSDFVQSVAAEQGRSVVAMTIKTVAFTMTTALGAKYLATLRRQPTRFASYNVLASIIFPTFPLSDLCISLYRTATNISKRGAEFSNESLRYYVCATLDMRAIPRSGKEADSVPLHHVPTRAEPVHEPYDVKWFVRILAVIALLIQATLSTLLWVRRARYHARTFLDDYVAMNASAVFVIASESLVILILNTSWRLQDEDDQVAKFKQRCNEPSAFHLLHSLLPSTTSFIEIRLSAVLGIFLQCTAFFSIEHSTSYGGGDDSSCFTPIFADLILSNLLGVSEMRNLASCHCSGPGQVTVQEYLLPLFGEIGYYAVFGLSLDLPRFLIFYLVVLAIKRLRPSWITRRFFEPKLVRQREMGCLGATYLLMCWGVTALTIWDFTDHRKWEQWMWKDPWAERLWIF